WPSSASTALATNGSSATDRGPSPAPARAAAPTAPAASSTSSLPPGADARAGSPLSASVRAVTPQHRADRAEEDPQVEGERPVADILVLHPHDFVETPHVVATVRLPRAGHPGHDAEPDEVIRVVDGDLRRERRARTDQAHLTAQHVEQLRHLVETRAAQPAADARHARIIHDLE